MTTLKGPDAGAYYVDGPGGYYLDGDEPPGQWLGLGAGALGLEGQVDDDHFLALMDGRDPIDREQLGTSHHERTVRGFDVTCSAPKSVSVLFAIGDEGVRNEVLHAHDAAVAAAFGWIEEHAHCRYRVDGEIWTVDAGGLVAAAFRQHTSRAHDPQVHTHLVIVNRVMAPDGRWLALDARTLKHDQRTVSALYAAGLRAELTSRLGVRWNEVENGQAEMADAPEEVLEPSPSAPRRWPVASRRRPTGSSTTSAAAPPRGSAGASSERQRPTAGPPRPAPTRPSSTRTGTTNSTPSATRPSATSIASPVGPDRSKTRPSPIGTR